MKGIPLVSTLKNMRMKYKLFLIFSLIVIVLGTISFLTLQVSWHFYEQHMYRESAQVLALTSEGMDEGLRQLEMLSLTVAVDSKVQTLLKNLHAAEDNFTRYRTKLDLTDRISTLVMPEDLVDSVHIFGTRQYPIPESIDSIRIDAYVKRNIMERRPRPEQYHHFLIPGEADHSLVSVRRILEVDNLALTDLGTLAIRIRMDKMANKYMRSSPGREAHLVITEGRNVVYTSDQGIDAATILSLTEPDQTFGVYELEGIPHFIASVTSDDTNWTYYHILSHENLFRNLQRVQRWLALAHLALFIALIYVGNRFSNWFVRPVESLVDKMKRAEKGDFQIEHPHASEVRRDEIGQIHFHFHVMMRKIDELIHDNYIKQLLVKESEFRAMQAQIKPHFIYNTLESINMMALEAKQEKISVMVEGLAHLLRSSVTRSETFITVQGELEIVRHYIAIQKIRFGDRLQIDIHCSEEAEPCIIPKFTIQPIVENVIHHALEKVIGTCKVSVYIALADGRMHIEVEDNGPGFADVLLQESSGLGLKNIDDRIKSLFDTDSGVVIENLDTGARVTLQMPAKWR